MKLLITQQSLSKWGGTLGLTLDLLSSQISCLNSWSTSGSSLRWFHHTWSNSWWPEPQLMKQLLHHHLAIKTAIQNSCIYHPNSCYTPNLSNVCLVQGSRRTPSHQQHQLHPVGSPVAAPRPKHWPSIKTWPRCPPQRRHKISRPPETLGGCGDWHGRNRPPVGRAIFSADFFALL